MPMTPYQQLLVKVIEEDPLFDRWCLDPRTMADGLADERPDVPRTKLFTYYTKDGVLHADRAGPTELLNRVSWPPSEIWPPQGDANP